MLLSRLLAVSNDAGRGQPAAVVIANASADPEILGLTADSRAVRAGFVFAALPGVIGTSEQINGSGFLTRGAQVTQVSINGLEPGKEPFIFPLAVPLLVFGAGSLAPKRFAARSRSASSSAWSRSASISRFASSTSPTSRSTAAFRSAALWPRR